MAEMVIYRSHVRIERISGQLRRVSLPAEDEPELLGTHARLASHYGVEPEVKEAHASPLDHFVAAVGADLVGSFGNALTARDIPVAGGLLTADVVGDIASVEKIPRVQSIQVIYHLQLEVDQRERAERVHEFHIRYCPLACTLGDRVEISTELRIEEL